MIAKLENQKTPKKHYPQNEQQSWNLWSQPWNRIYKDTVKFLNLFLISKKSLSGTIQNQIIFAPSIFTKSDLMVQK